MSETIDRARKLLEARLRELDAEADRLQKSLAMLGRRPAARRGRGKRRRSRGKRRAARGQRRQQFLAAVQKSPGARTSEISKQLGISSAQTSALAKRLLQSGEIKKSERGYRVAAEAGK